MVDLPAVAIFARQESIIDGMRKSANARASVLHIILISSTLFDSRT